MSSDYTVSYSFSVGGQQPRPATQDTALYVFEDCEEVSLPNGAVVLVSRSRPVQGAVTRDVAIALNHCRELRTLQGHAEHLTNYMPELGGDVAGVRQTLEGVRDTGLLVAADAYGKVIGDCPRGASSPAPSRVFIITCDRPAAVERLLESLLAGAELGRHESLHLVDDSRDGECAARNRELVQDFNLHSPVRMHYFGAAEREDFLARLAGRLPQHEDALRFLLDRERWPGQKTYGLARTLCLLLSVGRRAVVLDDDVVCNALDSPYLAQGVQFVDGMSEADFFPTAGAWQSRHRPRAEDPLRGHLRCLGLNLGDALDALTPDADLSVALEKSQAEVLARIGPGSRVLVTQNGTFGDPGTGDTTWCFDLAGASLERLLTPPGPAVKAATRQYWMGWSRPTFSSRGNMSQVTGLDNSAMLPPYFPAWRGEDLVFGAMVDFLHPDSLVLNYPWAVPHLPFEQRRGDIVPHPASAGMSVVESHIGDNAPRDPQLGAQTRLAALVLLVESLAQHSDRELGVIYRKALARDQGNALRNLHDKLRSAPAEQAEWRAMLQERQRAYIEAIGRREVPVAIPGVPGDMPEHTLWEHFRALARDFAGALAAWPAIREAAASLAGDGAG